MNFDVAIIGGSFAGLSSAYFLAKQGLNVCLFDSRKIGSFTKSTGIFTKSVMEDLAIPRKLIESEIFGVHIYSPEMREYEYRSVKPLFYQSNTISFLNWLKTKASEEGVIFFENKSCNKIELTSNNVVIENVNAKVSVIASGPSISYKKSKQVLYTGLEYIAKCDVRDEHMFDVYFDYQICPGYVAWVSPNNSDRAHIGVLLKANSGVSGITAMKNFIKKSNLNLKKIYETRGGLVPLGETIQKTYGERSIVIGDAAGQIGAFSSAGINYSIRASKILSEVLPKYLDNPTASNLKEYEKRWKSDFNKLLTEESELRKIYDLADSNQKIEKGLKILSKIPKEKILEIANNFSNLKPLNYKTSLLQVIQKALTRHFISKMMQII